MITASLWDLLFRLVHAAGFEPALPKETDLESVALDHSAIDPELFARHHLFDFNKYR